MLRQRLITAVVLIAMVLAFAFVAPTHVFAGFIALVAWLGGFEWARLAGFGPRVCGAYAALIVALVLGLWLGVGVVDRDGLELMGGVTFGAIEVLAVSAAWWTLVLVVLAMYEPGLSRGRLMHVWPAVVLLVGLFALVPSANALIWLHALGPMWLLAPMALVAAADTGAYFVGRRFGRHALAPSISPGKTREGVLGAVFAVVALGAIWAAALGFEGWNALQFILLGVIVGLWSVSGDLFESVLKRERGVKDSGQILPGHGGVLDRIDSLLVAAPLFLLGILLLEGLGVFGLPG
ncbi:MAG: phosphatidate cytidylyltransferase [Thioalkalivibrionaceae bacterium]